MKCMSCETEVNPKWQHAIDTNICPFCGQTIMNSDLKDLLSNLRLTLESLSSFPEELNDWLLSNFNFIKTDSPDLINYIDPNFLRNKNPVKGERKMIKVNTGEGEEEIETVSVQDQSVTNEFAKRAGILKKNEKFSSIQEKQKHLKSMVEQIKTGKVIVEEFDENQSDEHIDDTEVNEALRQDYIRSEISETNSSDEELPSVVETMISNANKSPSYNSRDVMKLQKMQHNQQSAQERMLSGGGGFSR